MVLKSRCLRARVELLAGEEVEDPYDGYVYPPVNGTPKLFGGVCDGVEKV